MKGMDPVDFPFRPWVRSTTRRAMIWGVGAVLVLGIAVFVLRSEEREAWGRAFGVLLAYSLLFWASLAKIWWTAGKPAIMMDEHALAYQPLHTFRPRLIPFASVLSCAPRPGTEALRLVVQRAGVARELFLNLNVVKGRDRFLDLLGVGLEAAGLEKLPGRDDAWRRPGWSDTPTGVGG